MPPVPESPRAPLARGAAYRIHRHRRHGGFTLSDVREETVAWLDLEPRRAASLAGEWRWSIVQPRLHAWALVFTAADGAEALRVQPRGEIVKYRMHASDGAVYRLRQNLVTGTWHLSGAHHAVATITLGGRDRPGSARAGRADVTLADAVQLTLSPPGEPVLSLCLLASLLCIQFEGIYNSSERNGAFGSGP